jgi:hypothetical protein
MNVEEALSDAVAKLRAAASAERRVEAAQMRLINLDDVLNAAGPDRPHLKERIRQGSLSFLRGCLADADSAIPCGDGFLIIFANSNPEEVTRRTEEIRLLLIQFYIGEEGLNRLNVQATRQSLPASALHALAVEELVIEDSSAGAHVHEFIFAPTWHTKKQAIISYFCTPVLAGPNGPIYAYDEAFRETGKGNPADFLAVDLEALKRVQSYLDAPPPAGAIQPALGVSVHVSTMRRRSTRTVYLNRLRGVAVEHGKRLTARISEIPDGTPISTLADWVGQLRAMVRIVLLQFHHTERPLTQPSYTGAAGAGFSAPQHGADAGAEPEAFMRQVRLWAASLKASQMLFFIDDVQSKALATAAADLGVQLLSSNTLWPYLDRPGEVHLAPLRSTPRLAG